VSSRFINFKKLIQVLNLSNVPFRSTVLKLSLQFLILTSENYSGPKWHNLTSYESLYEDFKFEDLNDTPRQVK
jgi:hypothetical protein